MGHSTKLIFIVQNTAICSVVIGTIVDILTLQPMVTVLAVTDSCTTSVTAPTT